MTTKFDIEGWFNLGVLENKTHLIVVCDTLDYEDYPVYADNDQDCWQQYAKYNGENMQKVMEIYDLRADKKEQIDFDGFVFKLPHPEWPRCFKCHCVIKSRLSPEAQEQCNAQSPVYPFCIC